MEIVLAVVAGIAAVVVLLVVLMWRQPDRFRVERSGYVSAPPEQVYPLVNNFHNWEPWSPWEKRDPNLRRTYDGPDTGSGAVYRWDGNKQVGSGRMTNLGGVANERINLKLEFFKPFAATNTTVFTFTPEGEGTRVNWGMEGENTTMGKFMALVISMDRMIGADFERGVAGMDQVVRGGGRNP